MLQISVSTLINQVSFHSNPLQLARSPQMANSPRRKQTFTRPSSLHRRSFAHCAQSLQVYQCMSCTERAASS